MRPMPMRRVMSRSGTTGGASAGAPPALTDTGDSAHSHSAISRLRSPPPPRDSRSSSSVSDAVHDARALRCSTLPGAACAAEPASRHENGERARLQRRSHLAFNLDGVVGGNEVAAIAAIFYRREPDAVADPLARADRGTK